MKLKDFFKKHYKWAFSGIGCVILSLILPFLLQSCEDDKNINETQISTTSVTQDGMVNIAGDNYGDINVIFTEYKANKENIPMTENGYLSYLEKVAGGDVVFMHYDDFDGDGKTEMYALVHTNELDANRFNENAIGGRLWFVNTHGAIEIESKASTYFHNPEKFLVGNKVFIGLEELYDTGRLSYLWGVIDGEPYQPNISGKCNAMSLNKYGEIELVGEDFDAGKAVGQDFGTGHTWKTYYFYFDDLNFREYGGILISQEELGRIKGINHVESMIKQKLENGWNIDDIYYRENGIININFSTWLTDEDQSFENLTIRCWKDKVEIVPYQGYDFGEGVYQKAFLPNAATYPKEFPF